MTHEYNTERIFEGKLKKKKDVVSVGGEYPISHLERELEKTLEKYPDSYARISIFIGSISKSILIKAKKKGNNNPQLMKKLIENSVEV